jgi:hypothetical protein
LRFNKLYQFSSHQPVPPQQPEGNSMNAIRLVAAAALLVASQAHAVTTITPNTLTATPSGQANGREINFKLPLAGDTKNCVITIAYGEKAGVGPNNDGDTHLNGQPSLDRVRTYSADGTYTFTAKAKSGCTGEAKVTFTIGNTARTAPPPALAAQPVAPAVAISANPGLQITPTKMTGIVVSSTKLTVGSTVTVKLNGVGDPKNAACGSRIKLEQVGVAEQWNGYPGVNQTSEDFNHWPKTQTFVFKAAGQYVVRLGVYSGAPASCGYQGPGSVPGDLTKIEVTEVSVPK